MKTETLSCEMTRRLSFGFGQTLLFPFAHDVDSVVVPAEDRQVEGGVRLPHKDAAADRLLALQVNRLEMFGAQMNTPCSADLETNFSTSFLLFKCL